MSLLEALEPDATDPDISLLAETSTNGPDLSPIVTDTTPPANTTPAPTIPAPPVPMQSNESNQPASSLSHPTVTNNASSIVSNSSHSPLVSSSSSSISSVSPSSNPSSNPSSAPAAPPPIPVGFSSPNDSRSAFRNVVQNAISTGVSNTRNVLSSLQQRMRRHTSPNSNSSSASRNGLNGPNAYNPYANDVAQSSNGENESKMNGSNVNTGNSNNNNNNRGNYGNNTVSNNVFEDLGSSDDSSDDDSVDTDMKVTTDGNNDGSGNGNNVTKRNNKKTVNLDKKLLLDELTCNLCFDLFYEPLTIVCGHTFCRECLTELLSKCEKKCPLCRTICHINPQLHCMNLTINNLIMKIFPKKYKKRKREYLKAKYPNKYRQQRKDKLNNNNNDNTEGSTSTDASSATNGRHNNNNFNNPRNEIVSGRLPMFVLNSIRLPTQTIALHLFEPRYLHMINRVVSSDRHFGYLCREIGKNDNRSDRGYRPYVDDIGLIAFVTECEFLPDGRCLLEAKCLKRIRIVDAWVERGTQGLWYAQYEVYVDSPLSELNLSNENELKLNEYCDNISSFVDKCYNDSSRYILQQIEKNCGSRVNLNKNINSNNFSEWSFFVFGLIIAFKDESGYSVRDIYRSNDFFKRIETCNKILQRSQK